MSTLADIVEGFRSTLSNGIPDVEVMAYVPGSAQTPCIIIGLDDPSAEWVSMGAGVDTYNFVIDVVVSLEPLDEAQQRIHALIDSSDASVRTVLKATPSLGLSDTDVYCGGVAKLAPTSLPDERLVLVASLPVKVTTQP